jgi:beta-ureidopropionase
VQPAVKQEEVVSVPRKVRAAVAQAYGNTSKSEALERQVALVEAAVADGAQVVGLQELCNGPYFCAQQDPKWFAWAEPDDGKTVSVMSALARRLGVVLVVPFFERVATGLYFNTAVVIDSDGTTAAKYRKTHIPHLGPCYWEKYFFTPGDLGYPVAVTTVGRIGVAICYDRHFPEVGRALGLNGAEIVFNPSATSDYARRAWDVEQPAQAIANGYFVAAINRVGVEEPLSSVRFFGSSYICDPRGEVLARAGEEKDEVAAADLDLDLIEEARQLWQFYRDRRPDTYRDLLRLG